MPTRKAAHDYQVVVGNIGTVYSGRNGFKAYGAFNTDYSNTRAEDSVTLFKDGDVVKERTLPPNEPDSKYHELGSACDDCVIAIANDDYSGMDDKQECATREGITRIGQMLVVGEELGFEHNRCVVCRGLPGNRHTVGYIED